MVYRPKFLKMMYSIYVIGIVMFEGLIWLQAGFVGLCKELEPWFVGHACNKTMALNYRSNGTVCIAFLL